MPAVIENSEAKPTKSNLSPREFLNNMDILPVPESRPETDGEKQILPSRINVKSADSTKEKGAFITQKGENFDHYKDAHNIEELEALVSGMSQTSQDTLLLKKKKEMREWSEALTEQKEIFKKRMEQCEIRKEKFEIEIKNMRERVLKFEKFILENDSKTRKAEKRRKSERAEKDKRIKELKTCQKKLLEEEQENNKLQIQLKSLQRFREYLDAVLLEANGNTYEEVNDVICRLNELKKLHVENIKKQQDLEEETDEVRLKFSNLQLETQNKLLMESSLFYSSQKDLDDLSSINMKRLHNKNAEQKKQQDLQRGIGQIVMAIKNLYFRCLATEGYSHIPRLKAPKGIEISPLQELDFYLKAVMGRINDLGEIEKEYKVYAALKMQNKKDISSQDDESITVASPRGTPAVQKKTDNNNVSSSVPEK